MQSICTIRLHGQLHDLAIIFKLKYESICIGVALTVTLEWFVYVHTPSFIKVGLENEKNFIFVHTLFLHQGHVEAFLQTIVNYFGLRTELVKQFHEFLSGI